MKIHFLGTSHGVPAADRYCSSALLETNGTYYLIDGGAPVIDLLLRNGININSIRAVFTTHGHGDHISGILQFADLINWHYRTCRIKIYMTETELIDAFIVLLEAMEANPLSERVNFILWDKDKGYEDENIIITLLPNSHLDYQKRPSYSLVIDCEGKRVVFTGDLSHNLKAGDFPDVSGVDLLVSEMAHFKAEHIQPYLEKCTAKRVVFNHVAPASKFADIAEMKGKYGFDVSAVSDNQIIEI